ncbi:MAG TPA: hypothetical protein PLD94_13830 [Ornithinibacter sp.]|nr:hypothetical protein [Ornithinibacter sp.]
MTEQQPYDVLEQRDGFALRRYPSHVVAEVELDRVGRHGGPGRPDRRGGGGYVVAFVLPASMTLETAPVRFDPPFTPWFLRRNEVVQDVTRAPRQGPGG